MPYKRSSGKYNSFFFFFIYIAPDKINKQPINLKLFLGYVLVDKRVFLRKKMCMLIIISGKKRSQRLWYGWCKGEETEVIVICCYCNHYACIRFLQGPTMSHWACSHLLRGLIVLLTDTAAIFNSIVSDSYYGMSER